MKRFPIVAFVLVAVGIAGLALTSSGTVLTPIAPDPATGFVMVGPGMMSNGYYSGGIPNVTPMTLDAAVWHAQQFVISLNNDDLVFSKVIRFSNHFCGEVKDRSTGNHAFELFMDKYTGGISPELGPNMIWNAKLNLITGMMRRL